MPAGDLCIAHARHTSGSRPPGPHHRRDLCERHLDHVRTGLQLVTAIKDLILDRVGGTDRDSIVTFELDHAAVRDQSLRSITESWMVTSRSVLARYLDCVTARRIDALTEGLIMHMILSARPISRVHTRRLVSGALGAAATGKPRQNRPGPA